MSKKLTLLAWLMLAASANAQSLLLANDVSVVNRLLDSKNKDSLDCSIKHPKPSMDFMFRYDAGYLFSCRLDQFEAGARVASYIRVTPRDGAPVLMGEVFDVPEVTPEVAKRLGKRLKNLRIEASGAVALGEGQYLIEFVAVDERWRAYHSHWTVRVEAEKDKRVPLALQPNKVAPLVSSDWDGRFREDGVRLTILLHAIPMFPFAARLYAWDRAFLLQSLTSLLKQTPCKSVSVIAFNLDQQREIFRQDNFGPEGFQDLVQALQRLELATVSYKALQRKTWAELLVGLAREQTVAKSAPDAVVFLGPSARYWDKIPKELKKFEKSPAQFFYFEYYPWFGREFPDAIDYLTHDLEGTVFRIHNADQLRQAIPKMLVQIKQGGSSASLDKSSPETNP